jgi:hypothetical protein
MHARHAAPVTLFFSLALAGCEDTPKERLEGRWVGERAEDFSAQQQARAAGWVTGASFEFKGNRVTVSIPAESPRQGTFKVAQVDGEQLRVSFLRPHGAADDVTLRFEGDQHLRWMLGDGRSIVLRKESD